MKYMKKYCMIIRIKPEHMEEYIQVHKTEHLPPWSDMIRAIHDAGFTKEVIYHYQNLSIVFMECEDMGVCDGELRAQEICRKWDAMVNPWMEEPPFLIKKIFDLEQQLNGFLDTN